MRRKSSTIRRPAPSTEPFHPHALIIDEVAAHLTTSLDHGLSNAEAEERLQTYGRNEISDGGGVNAFRILIKQTANAMVLVLFAAMAVSFGIGSYIEGAVVSGVILVNVITGFVQEYGAEKTMDSLRNLASPSASVIRSGHHSVISAPETVPGDLVEVKTGDTIPADIRLIETSNFETDEALLTGESLPVFKNHEITFPSDADIPTGDRINMAYSSSTVTKGRAKGIVVRTGMGTEIGSIAQSLRDANKQKRVRDVRRNSRGKAKPHRYLEAGALTVADNIGRFLGVNVGTPLQRKLSWLAIWLFLVAVVFAIICLGANRFESNKEVILYAVGTGLSMLPASLIVVLTITMAVGAKVMIKRNVIVRKLDSLEALGAVTNVCSDKTGTLTQGRMVVKLAWVPAEGTYSVGDAEDPIDPTGAKVAFNAISPSKLTKDVEEKSDYTDASEFIGREYLTPYLNVASLANIATITKDPEGNWVSRGDPTETALQVFACRFDHGRLKFTKGEDADWKMLAEYPFDSDTKLMSVIFCEQYDDKKSTRQWAFLKGAVERVLDACSEIQMEGSTFAMDEAVKDEVLKNMRSMASKGLRVLALASKPWKSSVDPEDLPSRSEVESNMVLQGLIGLYDPPRPETPAAVAECHAAGINVHMLTGDHLETAKAIAIQVGIIPSDVHMLSKAIINAMVMTASQFDALSDAEVDALPVLPLVIARCAPHTKVRMVEALHRRGKFVAMTGDGVNDSPALKTADVGIGMGMNGSDVAKSASDIVLTDDRFGSILNAIEEGRRMFDNIKKFVLHLLAENIAQACTLLIGLAFKDGSGLSVFPLAPVEIMWIIMITSSFPDMGLGMVAAAPDTMTRAPHNLRTGVFTKEVIFDMLAYGFWMASLCLSSFSLVVFGFGDGNLGTDCNTRYSPQCELVYRGRSTTFVTLTWFALILAWEMVHLRRSMFRMQDPDDDGKYAHKWTMWARDVWNDRFLFWSIVAGGVTAFPIIYIPGLNKVVFKHAPITWEWGIVLVELIVFVAGVEAWKYGKRVFFRRYSDKVKNPEDELTGVKMFERSLTDESKV